MLWVCLLEKAYAIANGHGWVSSPDRGVDRRRSQRQLPEKRQVGMHRHDFMRLPVFRRPTPTSNKPRPYCRCLGYGEIPVSGRRPTLVQLTLTSLGTTTTQSSVLMGTVPRRSPYSTDGAQRDWHRILRRAQRQWDGCRPELQRNDNLLRVNQATGAIGYSYANCAGQMFWEELMSLLFSSASQGQTELSV